MSEWWLYARKIGLPTHYGGLWQPRRNGSLKECTEEMMAGNLSASAFFLAFGTQESHERPID